jgi:hypothetical protein
MNGFIAPPIIENVTTYLSRLGLHDRQARTGLIGRISQKRYNTTLIYSSFGIKKFGVSLVP